jgi:hypothetical protein
VPVVAGSATAGKAGKGRRAVSIDTTLGLRSDDNRAFAGISDLDVDRDSIRGHHDRFVCQSHRLAPHCTSN